MNKISYFNKVTESSKPSRKITISEFLQKIKNNPNKNGIEKARKLGKYDPYLNYTSNYKKVNYYQFFKENGCDAVCVSLNLRSERKKSKISNEDVTGWMYLDTDDFSNFISNEVDIEQAIDIVFNILTDESLFFVKAVWRSYGGMGLGALVKCKNLTKENYSNTWEHISTLLAERGVKIDEATKDITRINVISYDPNIFIREDKDVIPLYTKKIVKKEKSYKIPSDELPRDISDDYMFNKFIELYKDHQIYEKSLKLNRLEYNFYLKFYSYTNYLGISREDSHQYLISKEKDYPLLFKFKHNKNQCLNYRDQIYNSYGDQSNKNVINVSHKLPLEYQYKPIRNHVTYTGDVENKLQYHWYLQKFNDFNIEKKLKIFIKKCKSFGILKTYVKDFFVKNQIKNLQLDVVTILIDEIYSKVYFPFGLIKEYTNEAIKEQKRLYELECKRKGFTIYKLEEFPGNIKETFRSIINYATHNYGSPNLENAMDYLTYVVKECKKIAITKEGLKKLINQEFDISEDYKSYISKKHKNPKISAKIILTNRRFNRLGLFLIDEIYDYQKWKFGVYSVKEYNTKDLYNMFNVEETLTLPDDKKLTFIFNETDFKLEDKVILWGDTNMGKTTYICRELKQKRIVLVPITSALENIEMYHGASVYYEDKKNVSDGDDLIVCTYSSFPNLLKKMLNWETPIQEYELYMDEHHNNAVSASLDYRNFELNSICDHINMFKKSVFLTGTLLPILHEVFDDFKVVRVQWDNPPEVRFKTIRYEDKMASLPKFLSKNGKNIIYYQNKKIEKGLNDLIEVIVRSGFDRKRIGLINADTKDSELFKSLIKDEMIPDDYDILICTSVIVEAINVKNEDIKTLHFLSYEHPVLMQQMAFRFRIKRPEMIYVYKSINNRFIIPTNDFNSIDFQTNMIIDTESNIQDLERPANRNSLFKQRVIQRHFKDLYSNSGAYIRSLDGIWVVDYLSIANNAYNREKDYSYTNHKFMKTYLSLYNWIEVEEIEDYEVKSEELEEELKMLRNDLKEEILEDYNNIIDTIEGEGEDYLFEVMKDSNKEKLKKLKRPEFQLECRSNIKYLCGSLSFEDSVNLIKKLLNEYNYCKETWKRIKKQITIKLAEKTGVYDEAMILDTQLSVRMLKYYEKYNEKKEKPKISLKQINNLINDHLKALDYPPVSEVKAMSIYQKYFDVVEITESKTVKYQIRGLRILNDVATFKTRLLTWAEEMYNNDEGFTDFQLTKTVDNMLIDLPLLNKILKGKKELSRKNTKKLIRNYIQIKKKSSKKAKKSSKRKKDPIFKVISLEPLETEGYNVIPQRRVKLEDKKQEDLTYEEKIKLRLITESLPKGELLPI